MENRHLALLLLSSSAFVFFVIGSSLPGWIVLHVEIDTVNNKSTNIQKVENSTETVTSKSQVIIQVSLWYVQVCMSGNCEMKTWTDARSVKGMQVVNSVDVVEYRIEGAVIFAFSFSAICVVFANARIRKLSLQSEATAAMVLAVEVLVEGILLIRVSGSHTDTEKDIASSPNISLEYAYSLVIVGFSVLFSGIGVYLAGVGACKEKKPALERFTNLQTADMEVNDELQTCNLPPGEYNLQNMTGLNSIPEEPSLESKSSVWANYV